MENARIIFRNFAGKEGKYNREGDRNFCVLLDHATAESMVNDGWNIKVLKPREEGEPGDPYIQVSIGFKVRPPTIVMVTSRGRTTLSEDELELLDWVDIEFVDLIVNPYEWSVNGKTGIKAYLKSFFVTIHEDYLVRKYQDVPEIGAGPERLAIESNKHFDYDGEVVEDAELIEDELPARAGRVKE